MIKYEIFTKTTTIATNDIRLAHEYRDKGFEVVTVVDLEIEKCS